MTAPEPNAFEQNAENAIDQAVADLHVVLPNGGAPKPFKIIALATFVGGLGMIGSLLADIVHPAPVGTLLYLQRLLFGICAIVVAYGLSRKESWSVWLYSIMVAVSFLVSPVFAVLPALIVLYLILKRKHLKASFPEYAMKRIAVAVRAFARKTCARLK